MEIESHKFFLCDNNFIGEGPSLALGMTVLRAVIARARHIVPSRKFH